MNATRKMANYIRSKGISIKKIATVTKIPVNILYTSFQMNENGRKRPLRVDEFLAICTFLEEDPMKFRVTAEESQAC